MHRLVRFGEPRIDFSKVIVRTSPIFADFDLFDPNDLEGQGQITPYTIPSEIFPRYTCKPNLVILGPFFQSYRADKQCLTDRQTDGRTDGQTDGRTDGQTQATTIPLGHTGRGVKTFRVINNVSTSPCYF